MLNKFWEWYKRNLFLNQLIVAVLFGWQLLHLYWLTTNVVAEKIVGQTLFNPSDFYQSLLITADYFEIPALISGTLLYLHTFRREGFRKNLAFIVLINSQWLHLFWITDEFVVSRFASDSSILPIWLAWIAIFIDYLELPVIYDTLKKATKSLFKKEPELTD